MHFTSVINFGTFLRLPLQNNNVKLLNLRFCGEREHMTVNCSFSVSTWMPFLPILFHIRSATLYKLNELE